MAANETEIPANKLKTQSFGRGPTPWQLKLYPGDWTALRAPCEVLKNYKENRENGDSHCVSRPFPDGGFSELDGRNSACSYKGWPDTKRRYWWKITCKDGRVIEDFYWTKDMRRGFPDTFGRWWFIVHGPNGLKIEQFSIEPDHEKGYPDKNRNYWSYFQYTENGSIKQWMEQKDKSYLARLTEKKSAEAQPFSVPFSSSELLNHSVSPKFSFLRPFKLPLCDKTLITPGLILNSYLCPITHEIMLDPVLATDGHTYEREAILQALELSILSPMTGERLESKSVFPNFHARSTIRDFLTKHPECWQEVYISKIAMNDLLALFTGNVPIDLQKFGAILGANPRLLTLPLKEDQTILELICHQQEQYIKTYLPALLDLLRPQDWKDLMRVHSAQDWLKLITRVCEEDSIINLSVEFLNKMQTGLEIKINPVEIALYALEQKNLGLFKLALRQLPDVNEVIDAEQNTLLHLAAIQGQTKMVECLINRGADLKKRNAAGLKAQSLARQAGFQETADNIAVLKLTPVLERMGFFDGLRQLEILKEEVAQLKKVSMGL